MGLFDRNPPAQNQEPTPQEQELMTEQGIRIDAMDSARPNKLDNLVDLLQDITKPTPVVIEKVRYLVLQELGLGYISEEMLDAFMLHLKAAQLYMFMGALDMCRIKLEEIVQRLFLTRSIKGQYVDKLLTTSIEKRLVTVSQSSPQKGFYQR